MTSSLKLTDPVEKIHGVGPRSLQHLNKLGIFTVRDLLWYFPFRYNDYSQIKKINELQEGEIVSLIVRIKKISIYRSPRKRMFIINAQVEDDTGVLPVIWFNQVYLRQIFKPGMIVSLSGKVRTQGKKFILSSPNYEIISSVSSDTTDIVSQLEHTGRLVPVYPETKGFTSRAIRYLIKPILKKHFLLQDPLPEPIRNKYNLFPFQRAIKEIHFPSSLKLAEEAKKRFIFESLFLSQLYLLRNKRKNSLLPAPKIKLDLALLQQFVRSLPYKLTDDQRKALWVIVQNMNKGPMNRLLEGEVGSGKTVIAMGASLLVTHSGYQVALMAPTEILAYQHFQNFVAFLKQFPVKVALLTSSRSQIYDEGLEGSLSKEALRKMLHSSYPIIVIGTHALIQKKVKFAHLGLIIVDEQHRFGTEQRKQLITNNSLKKNIPHLLSMTATPIPRTLALAFYGNIDLSILRELPSGRKKIITKIIPPKKQSGVYQFIEKEIKKGRQAFVICPRIEEQDRSQITAGNLLSLAERLRYEAKAVKKEYQKLQEEIFPNQKVAMLHGKMKPKEKMQIMNDFKDHKIDILVSTSVIEVGVDIPNASLMIIEDAEFFGLAQLHQFRGRIGRSQYQSYCFLFSDSSSPSTIKRLRTLEKCNDGFRLAEIDLSLRGPGEFLGSKQSGLPDLVMRSLFQKELIEQVHQEAQNILKKDPSLAKWPLLAESLKEFSQKLSR